MEGSSTSQLTCPASKGLFTQKGGVDGERGGMAVIQYETIEHLNLELDIVDEAFRVTSVLQQRDFYERVFFYIYKM